MSDEKKLTKKEEKLLVVVVSIFLFFIGVHRGGTQLVIADIADMFGVGTEGVGMFASLQHIPPLFGPICAGIIADKIGKKPIVTIFVFLFAIGCVICGFSSSLTVFCIGMFVYSLGSTVSEMMSTATMSDVNVEKSAQYINISQFMFSMGAVVGPLLVQFFSDKVGTDWRFPFAFGFLSFIVMGTVLAIVKFPTAIAKAKEEGTKESIFSFITPILLCLLIAMLLYIGMETGYGNFIDSVMMAKSATDIISAFVLSAFWFGMAISRLVFSVISYKPGTMLRMCFTACAVLLVAITFVPAGVFSIAISALIGFAYGPIWCTIEAVAAASSNGNSGKAIGIMSIGSGIGGIVLPTLIGKAATAVKVQNALLVLAVAAVIGAIVCLKVKDEKKH